MRIFIEQKIEDTSELDWHKNEGYHIVFIKGQGYQWSKYHNGSKTWQSMITKEDITEKVSHFLKTLSDE